MTKDRFAAQKAKTIHYVRLTAMKELRSHIERNVRKTPTQKQKIKYTNKMSVKLCL